MTKSKPFSSVALNIFERSINDYHQESALDSEPNNPYLEDSIEWVLYLKSWIDTIQWHYEDLIRDPHINPKKALVLKRKIDASNQRRTDVVERIDSFFLEKHKSVMPNRKASINTESPAWAIDRLSILALKIYHMREEVGRENASETHTLTCSHKLKILEEQKKDLSVAIDELLKDIAQGDKYMKVYKQMKMYNDKDLNPILYGKKEEAS